MSHLTTGLPPLRNDLRGLANSIVGHAMNTPGEMLDGYMERFLTAPDPKLNEGQSISQRVHHILRADHDRDYHTHPWQSITVILAGWYIERRPADPEQPMELDQTQYVEQLYRAGESVYRRASDAHRIIEVSPGGVWTLFSMGPWEQDWGFRTPEGFVYWRDYLERQK